MEPVAYGALALKPWEFGQLTPGELRQMIDGYLWRSQRQEREIARFVAPIINTCSSYELKQPVTVDLLLGIKTDKKTDKKTTAEQARAELDALIAKVG